MSSIYGLKPCLACTRKYPEHEMSNYLNDTKIRTKFHEFLQIELVRDRSLPETICCNCIMRINCCLEFQRCIIRNMLNHRIRYYYNNGDRANVVKYQTECKSFQTKCMTLPSGVSESFFNDSSLTRLLRNQPDKGAFLPDSIVNNDTAGLIISDVRTEELPQEPDSTGDEIDEMEIELSNNGFVEANTSVELLEPMFQTSENALDTESGGNIHVQNDAIAARRKQTEPTSYQCQHCNRVYRRSNAWRKHLRTHQVTDQRKPISEKPKHKCSDCNQEFESVTVLRKHSIVHEKQFICKFCGELFRLMHDYSWHIICCEAKNAPTNSSIRRRTRSQGRTSEGSVRRSNRISGNSPDNVSVAASRLSVDSTQTDSMYNERIEVVKLWAKQLDIGDKPDPKDLTSNNVRDDDCVSIMSDISSMTRLSEVSSISTSSSVQTSSSSILSCGRSNNSSTWAHEQKRRKLHKAGKRRAKQKGKEYYACSFRNSCSFGSTSLSKTMYHEVKVHNALLLHQCVECNEWFTNKENLIRHKKRHRPQLHICISCNYKFDNKYELEHHTLLHAEKSFNCDYCEMSFLKRAELERHINGFHQSDVIQKYGIIDRVTAIGKSQASPYLRKLNDFIGYKSKELIQTPSPETKVSNRNALTNQLSSIRFNSRIENRNGASTNPKSNWNVYSVGSRYSKSSSGNVPQNQIQQFTPRKIIRRTSDDIAYNRNHTELSAHSTYNDYTGSPVPFYVNDSNSSGDDKSTNINRIVAKRSNTPQEPLECFDVFSVQTLGLDEPLTSLSIKLNSLYSEKMYSSKTKFSANYKNGIDNKCNGAAVRGGGSGDNNIDLQLPRRKINRSLITLPIILMDKYIPPYDVLFEKYLTNKNVVMENDETNVS